METAVGRVYHVDAVVLAIGAGSPAPLPGLDEAATSSTRYGADPWSLRLPSKPLGEAPILIAGAGLTMVDMVLDLAAKIPDASFLALSRRGLWPLEHAEAASPALPPPPDPGGPAEILPGLSARRKAWDGARPWTPSGRSPRLSGRPGASRRGLGFCVTPGPIGTCIGTDWRLRSLGA